MPWPRNEKVGIIGAGALGKAIAIHLSRCCIRCLICNSREPTTLEAVVRAIGPNVQASTFEEAVAPEIVVIAVPWRQVPEILEHMPNWEGRIIIDATHPPLSTNARDGEPGGAAASERIARLAPGAHVVMAFNTLPAEVLAQAPQDAGGRRVLFYSGDHARAKRKVAALIARLGFSAIDLGSLADGGRLQQSPGALAMLNLVQR